MGLLGPNGAGKSTLMRIMFGILDPVGGDTMWQGRPADLEARIRWGYMPQERGLYPAMPVGEQLMYFARLHGFDRAAAQRSARMLLDELGLADRWADRPDTLSGGMQQRLQLAVALVHNPEVIVLDEPFAGLDPVAVAELSATLMQRVRTGCTVLFSSHQLDLVQHLCEDIVMLHHGRIALQGSVAQLRAGEGTRQLRISISGASPDWFHGITGVVGSDRNGEEFRLELLPGVEPLDVLDHARAAGQVVDFGLELPTLSQLFLEATHEQPEALR